MQPPPQTEIVRQNRPALFSVLARNAVANLIQSGSTWVTVLLLPPLLVRVLDPQTYGTWLLLLQLGAYIVLIDAGIQSAVSRFVARTEGLGPEANMTELMSSISAVLLIAGTVALAAVLLVSWQLPNLFRSIPPLILKDSRSALIILGTSLAVALPFSSLAGFFRGYQRNEIIAIWTVVGKFFGAVGVAWAAYHHMGLAAMAAWSAAGNLLPPIAYSLVWKRWAKYELLQPSEVSVDLAREFVTFWSAMLISQMATMLITGMDMPIVVAFDFGSAAYYGVATTLSNMLIAPQGAILTSLLPVAASLSVKNSPERMGAVLRKITRYGTAILILLTLPLTFGMNGFLHIWVGEAYAQRTILFAELLVIAQFIRLLMAPYAVVGFSVGQQQKMLVSPIVEAIVNVCLSLILVQRLGAAAVAIGTIVGSIVGVVLHFTNSMRKTDAIRTDIRPLIREDILKPIALTLPVVAILLLAKLLPATDYAYLVIVAAAEIILAFVLFRFLLRDDEQDEILALWKKSHSSITRFILFGR